MNYRYNSTTRHAVNALAVAMLLLSASCHDDFGYQNVVGKQIALKITAPEAWHGGMTVNEDAPTTHCTSVRALSGDGGDKLYLHTVVADNPVEKYDMVSRGTPVKDTAAFKTRYSRFSLSGICYTGTYPADGENNTWTPEYAYNLYYSTSTATPAEGGRPLLWPSNGSVIFFAFAPTVDDFKSLDTDGSLTLSAGNAPGSPTLTYTVPTDVTKQVDLMTVRTPVSATTTPSSVELKFGHALTAVQLKCGKDMLAGTINEVTIAGIHGTGKQVIGSDTWETSGSATYTISKNITLPPKGNSDPDRVHTPDDTPIAGTDDDNLTFMLLPQTLPSGATMTIKFTDTATGTQHTLTGSIAGATWEAGKIVTYSISPSSIHIRAKIEFNKKVASDILPYTGVWYDTDYKAHVELTQDGVEETNKIKDIDPATIKFKYQVSGKEEWNPAEAVDVDKNLLVIAPQPEFYKMKAKFTKKGEAGTEDRPYSLSDEYSQTANCYLVDQAGYYSLALVYGNGNTDPVMTSGGLKYFVGHDDQKITSANIPGVSDAVLLWQDSPGLIDPESVTTDGTKLSFHIREHTLAQGNAVVAVRNSAKDILWSWHIWVTPYKAKFYSDLCPLKTTINATATKASVEHTYKMSREYNLGWCDSHHGDPERKVRLRAIIDMSYFGGSKTHEVDIPGEFTQMEFKGSLGGDNTYYQWGRKDAMLGGIYNDDTPEYTYYKKGSTFDDDEFTMENKPVFDQYQKDDCDYSFRKNPGDVLEPSDYASTGVSIGYSIKHPYMFITNSRENGTSSWTGKTYRNHWHKIDDADITALGYASTIMYNAWNAAATGLGYDGMNDPVSEKISEEVRNKMEANAQTVVKTIYDPCPPKFKIPPVDAFRALSHKNSQTFDANNNDVNRKGTITKGVNMWTVTLIDGGGSITFHATGVRDYALRQNEWNTVNPASGGTWDENDRKAFLAKTIPAFNMLTFVSSATIMEAVKNNTTVFDANMVDQILVLYFDNRKNQINRATKSGNSYGLIVRPIYDE